MSYLSYISVEVGQHLLSSESREELQSWGKARDEMGGRLVLLHLEMGGVPAEEKKIKGH